MNPPPPSPEQVVVRGERHKNNNEEEIEHGCVQTAHKLMSRDYHGMPDVSPGCLFEPFPGKGINTCSRACL